MAPYLIAFALSLLIFVVIQGWGRSSADFVVMSVIALSIPCFIAGSRDLSVGTDVQVYVQPLFDLANRDVSFFEYQTSSWWNSWRHVYPHEYEIGFSFLVWLVARITHSMPAVLFAIQMATIVPLYLGLLKIKRQFPLWLGMLVYYLLYFNSTLNVMRQWIAVSILLFAFHYLLEGKRFQYIVSILLSTLFHTSALLGFAVLAIDLYVRREGGSAKGIIILAIVAATSFLGVSVLGTLLVAVGLERYVGYLGSVYVLPYQLMLRAPLVIILLYYWSQGEDRYFAALCLGMLCFDALFFSQLASANAQSGRIGYYFASVAMVYLPVIVGATKNQLIRIGLTVLVIAYCAVYWFYTYAFSGAAETIPFAFNLSIMM